MMMMTEIMMKMTMVVKKTTMMMKMKIKDRLSSPPSRDSSAAHAESSGHTGCTAALLVILIV